MKNSDSLKFVQESICQICETNEHPINDYLTFPSFNEYLHEQTNDLNNFQRPNPNLYSQTYNPGSKNHPNLTWKSNNNNA